MSFMSMVTGLPPAAGVAEPPPPPPPLSLPPPHPANASATQAMSIVLPRMRPTLLAARRRSSGAQLEPQRAMIRQHAVVQQLLRAGRLEARHVKVVDLVAGDVLDPRPGGMVEVEVAAEHERCPRGPLARGAERQRAVGARARLGLGGGMKVDDPRAVGQAHAMGDAALG